MRVIQFLFVHILHNLKATQGNCQARCELTNRPTTDTRMATRALVGHSFTNFTVNKPYDCRCQAYQIKGKHSCELLDEDRFVAPDDFVEDQEYKYYDTSREYEKAVRYYQFEENLSYKDGLSSFNWSIKGVIKEHRFICCTFPAAASYSVMRLWEQHCLRECEFVSHFNNIFISSYRTKSYYYKKHSENQKKSSKGKKRKGRSAWVNIVTLLVTHQRIKRNRLLSPTRKIELVI